MHCDTYTWNSTAYTSSGTYTWLGTNANGCDSTAILNLTITPLTTTGSVTTSICAGDSYVWPANGQTYTTAQTGVTVVTGCNTATLNLTITPLTTTGSVTTSICAGDSYVWPANGVTYTTAQSGVTVVTGCNTATLNLTITPLTTNGNVTTSICAGDSYTWPANGVTYTTAQSGLTVVNGCNTATLNLTISNSTSNTTAITVCDAYTWLVNGQNYTSSGIYTDVSTNAAGCTHIETLNLTIYYLSNTSQNIVLCDGESYVSGLNTYSSPGVYVDNFITSNGCDSTAILNLSVLPVQTVIINLNSNELEADVITGSATSYLWNTGEATQSITPISSGTFWVVVTDINNCISDTAYYNYNSTSLIDVLKSSINIYPNPTIGMVNVEFFNTSTTSIILQNVLGERLAEVTYSDKGTINTQFDLSNFAKGIYFIHFKTNNSVLTHKVSKN